MITIAGVDKDTPTMPIPTSASDGVKVGNTVMSIGYGATAGGAMPTPSNVRKNVTMKISKIHGQDGVTGTTQLEDDSLDQRRHRRHRRAVRRRQRRPGRGRERHRHRRALVR